MVYYLIMCRSLTYAQRIVQTLERSGINAWLVRSPASISPSGCSHSVKIAQRNLPKALTVLNRVKLPYLGIYVGSPEEGYQEVEL
jgi:hypothetical protein